MARCHRCDVAVDLRRASARITAGRIVYECSACAGSRPLALPTTAAIACAGCGRSVPIAEARTSVRDGLVVPQCADCAAGRAPKLATPPAPTLAPALVHRRAFRMTFAAAVLALVAAPGIGGEPPRLPDALEATIVEPTDRDVRFLMTAQQDALQYGAYMANDPRPVHWHHPLAGDRRLPGSPSRRFGALRDRPGTRAECGRGHCGVDLGHRRGEIVHAAGDGIVDRIVDRDDDLSGRYVRIRHSQGYTSFYMHLGRIHPKLEVGQVLRAGDPIGTIGMSGIDRSPPHLHFAICRSHENGEDIFEDPEPMLRTATVRPGEAPFPGKDQS
jgi:murein DD-endopeptidase MepM/ murein hydrolase activator NlpD